MQYNILSVSDPKIIHDKSLEILSTLGVEVNSTKAKEVYLAHGCIVDENTNRILIPKSVAEHYIAMFPPKFTFHARDEKYTKTIPDDAPVFFTAASAPLIIDPLTGMSRPSTSEDIARLAQLANELPGIDVFTSIVIANDAPVEYYSIGRHYVSLKNSKKIVRPGATRNIEEVDELIQICADIAGSEEAFFKRPFLTIHCTPIISPLRIDETVGDTYVYMIEKGLPVYSSSVANGGMTAPMSLEATAIQTNAEFLSIGILTQMVKEGTELIYGTFPTMADMRNAAYVSGGIENTMLVMAASQMARFYNVPSSGFPGLTNSKCNDEQAGYEYAYGVTAAALGGLNALISVGVLNADMACDMTAMVIQSDINEMIRKMINGYDFNSADVDSAIENLYQCASDSSFIESMYTFQHARTATYLSQVSDRSSEQQWIMDGKKSTFDRAFQIMLNTLKKASENPNPYIIPQEIDSKILERHPNMPRGEFVFPKEWENLIQ